MAIKTRFANDDKTPAYYIIKDNYDVHALESDLANGVLNNLSKPEYHYFCNALEYLIRFKNKNGVQDLDKAISEIELLKSASDE